MARRIAATLYFVPGLGIAISTLMILAYQARRSELPMTPFGWRLMGSTVRDGRRPTDASGHGAGVAPYRRVRG